MFNKEKKAFQQETLGEILHSFYLTSSLSVAAYDTEYRCIEKRYQIELIPIAHDYIQGHLPLVYEQFLMHATAKEKFILITDELNLTYATIGIWSGEEKLNGLAIIGPLFVGKHSKSDFENRIKKLSAKVQHKLTLTNSYDFIPKLDEMKLRASCKVLIGMLSSNVNYFNAHVMNTVQLNDINKPAKAYIYPKEMDLKQHQQFFADIMHYAKKGDKERIQRVLTKHFRELKGYSLSMDLDEQKFNTIWLLNLFSLPLIELGVSLDEVGLRIYHFQKAISQCNSVTELTVLAEGILDELLNEAIYQRKNSLPSPLNKALFFIYHHFQEEIDLSIVANEVHMSPKYFSRFFKENMGVAFSSYLNEQRIKKAKELLDYTDDSIIDIALAVGFKNQNYFSTIFKKYTGTTPNKYRLKI